VDAAVQRRQVTSWQPPVAPELIPLCRNDAQLDAVIAAGLPQVELDWMELVGLTRAVDKARAAGLRVTIATVRVQKPGEDGYDRRIARLKPDGVLVRHWGGLMQFAQLPQADRPAVHGDFSLNVTNSLTAHHLLALGADTLTVAHDLDETQLLALLTRVPAERLTVTVHHHIPTFHTEHCVYAHLLSQGKDFRTCGRPCETHAVSLRDHVGQQHPVIVDVGCRNTVFNAQAQSAAEVVPTLLARGVKRFRVEFVRESEAEARSVLQAWQALLAGALTPTELHRQIEVHEQFGVTSGTMRTLGGQP
jgi:putative protease